MLDQSGAAGDPVLSALNRVAEVAEREAQVQVELATAARTAVTERRAGQGGDGFGHRVRGVIDLLAGSTERLVGGAAELRRAWAAHLAGEGLSRREIAERLGVTRQRVSVLLGGNGAAADSPSR